MQGMCLVVVVVVVVVDDDDADAPLFFPGFKHGNECPRNKAPVKVCSGILRIAQALWNWRSSMGRKWCFGCAADFGTNVPMSCSDLGQLHYSQPMREVADKSATLYVAV